MALPQTYPQANVSFDDYKNLVAEVESYRASRIVSFDEFLRLSQQKGVIILDTRSKDRYLRKHLKGARHLAFTDFTQTSLTRTIGNRNTTILIYCNNNFINDVVDFASKIAVPVSTAQKPLMMALNIPTFINLYGYGYQNIYELGELLSVGDPRVVFEGTEVQ